MDKPSYDPEKHHRHSLRMKNHNYMAGGRYFVTICVWQKELLFGKISDEKMICNECGDVVKRQWEALLISFPEIVLDAFVVMPNHFHAILTLQPLVAKDVSLGAIIGTFKSLSAREVNALLGRSERPLWQRNYYETYIRNNEALQQIQNYIYNNPQNWIQDEENPINLKP